MMPTSVKMAMLARRSGGNNGGGNRGGGQRGNRGGSEDMGYAYGGGINNAYNEGVSTEMGGGQRRMGYAPSNEVEARMGGREMEVESRFRDRRGREHYNNGRFAPMRNGVEVEGDVVFSRIPPIYTPETGYRYEGGTRMIGFAGGSGRGMDNMPMDELAPLREQRNHGHRKPKPMDRETAKAWVSEMHNADGSVGEHWTYEQAVQLMRQKGLNLDPAEFYATINMLWSDYGQVARKTGQDNAEYWADMAKAFLSDADAKPNKLALYYECIVK